MGFHSIELLEKSREFKLFLKNVINKPYAWASRIGISTDTAYSYLDTNRLDKNLPVMLVDRLDPREAEDILTYVRQRIDLHKLTREDLLPKTNVHTIMEQYSRMMQEFSDFSMHIIKSTKSGSISEEDIKEYETKRAALMVAEIRLFKLMKAVAGDKWEGVL